METDPDFTLTQQLPNSQFHFKPERISDIGDEFVTMDGREAMSNNPLSIKIHIGQFTCWCVDYSKYMIPLLVNYHRHIAGFDKIENKKGENQIE